MANKIILKKSSVASKIPLASDLEVGELAVNLADAKLYSKDASGTVISVGGGGGGSGDVVGPSSSTDNALARFDGTTGKLIQNGTVTEDDSGNMAGVLSQQFSDGTAVTVAAGKMWYNNTDGSWNMGMGGGNITQQVGEEIFLYGKASSAISDSPLQIVYQTGVVGASGHITFAPTVSGITDANLILGCATESIATNGFGRITTYGTIHNITTNGTAYGETWADGDVIWYNPVTGNPTKTKPSAPNIKVQLGIVTHAGSGGSGSFFVLIQTGTALGGTDSNVNISSPTGGNLLSYDQTNAYWKNINLTDGTGISVTETTGGAITIANTGVTSIAGTAGEVEVSASTGSVTVGLPATTVTAGSYTNASLTVDANGRLTAASSGTAPVTSVSGTAPISSSGGTTPAISISQASSTTNGYLSSTDWNTFNNKTSNTGTVTSVGMTVPTGLSVSGTPVTTSGTLAITYTAGYSIPTTASQTNWDTAYSDRLKWDGGSTGLVAATGRTSLGATTVGANFFTLTNPTAVTFPRINADNTVSALDAATFRSAIGAGTGSGTVTGVTATSPVASSGGTAPVISLASGYGDTQNPYASKTANYILAAPNGVAGAPTFRAMVAADVPTLNQNTTGTAGGLSGTPNISVGTVSASGVVTSTVATGTAPFTIASTTLNTNLNADYLDGNHASAFYLASNPSSYIALSSAITGYTVGTNTALAATDTLLASLGKIQGQINARGTGTVTSVTGGSYLTGGTITSSGTLAVDATSANTASKVVARDASGNFSAGTITATLNGNASTATTATTATNAANATNATYTSYPAFSGDSVSKDNITTRTDSGFYESSTGTTAEGWPVNDSSWQHMIATTHSNDANYYSMQIGGSFFDNVFYGRKTNGSGTTGWVQFITSGNIGSQSVNYATTAGNGGVTSVNGSTGAVTVSGGQFFGSAATKAIAYNSNTIGENITVTAGNNGLSAGPITISTGFTVTVQTGANWVIV